MAEQQLLKIHLVYENKIESVPFTDLTTAEDVCIVVCMRLGIGPVARHVFSLRYRNKPTFLTQATTFKDKVREYDFRIRFKPADFDKFQGIDEKAYEYFYEQSRLDVIENKISDLLLEKYRKELVGLAMTDMYHTMIDKKLPLQTIVSDYKKFVPKEVVKRHGIFIKKPIRDYLNTMTTAGHKALYVKTQYLKQLDKIAPDFMSEEYKVVMEEVEGLTKIFVRVSQTTAEPGITYKGKSEKDTWTSMCSLEDLAFISIRPGNRIEICRKNGIPVYLVFDDKEAMYSFISGVDGYYRLAVKWTFNVCKDVITPSLQKLFAMRCHGPIGGHYSYAKLEEKRDNRPGSFIVRECNLKYNIYYIDVCTKDSSKPLSYKLEKLSTNEFIFNDDLKRYKSLQQLITAYGSEDRPIWLKDCVPPSEYDNSPLLLCQLSTIAKEAVTDISALAMSVPLCINYKDLQVFKGQTKESTTGHTIIYRSLWKHTKGKKLEVAMKMLQPKYRDSHLKDMLELAGKWVFVHHANLVKIFGVTLLNPFAMVMEYVKMGPLDEYLRQNKEIMQPVELLQAAVNLASALWHLEEKGIVHGNIRCRKLLVFKRDSYEFSVKLADPGVHRNYERSDIHWIPIECYSNPDTVRASTAADVWAYGTTLWEIFKYGTKITSDPHAFKKAYVQGKRLPQPENCPKEIYKVMMECWNKDPDQRIGPQAIVRDVSKPMYEVYNSRRMHTYQTVNPLQSQSSSGSTRSLISTKTASTVAIDDFVPVDASIALQEKDLTWGGMMSGPSSMIENNSFELDSSSEDISTPSIFAGPSSEMLEGYSTFNSMQTCFELDDYRVILQGRIGVGHYGEVYRGCLEKIDDDGSEPIEVAVKKLKKASVTSSFQDFEREINIMKALRHPNIVQIRGVQYDPEVMLVMEFSPLGSLESYVKIRKDQLSERQLLHFALDIAKGMRYLGHKNIVHRDLGARNILVFSESLVKISDFGLAQCMDAGDYYMLKTNRDLPVKWYAPESLQEGRFSPRSDVWSYGVVLWEMFSHGELPRMVDTNNREINAAEQFELLRLLESGVRYPCLPQISRSIYIRIIHPCWDFQPRERPTFAKLCEIIEEELANPNIV